MMFTLMFGDYTFPNHTFEVTGLPIDNNIQENKVPRRHGVIIPEPYLQSRKIKISGVLHNASNEDTHSQWLAMQLALLAGENKFYYRTDRYVSCLVKSMKQAFREGTDKAVADVDIDLIAQNPFLYSAGASYSVNEDVSGITYSFSIFSGGNVFSEPNIFFNATGATITNDILLDNLTTGEQMRWRGTLGVGQTLSIDTENLEIIYGAFDGMSRFEGDFLKLLPGTNSFQYIGADCRITIEHKWRWYA